MDFNESHMKNHDNVFEMLLSKAIWTLESFQLIFMCKPHTHIFLVATADLKNPALAQHPLTISLHNYGRPLMSGYYIR